MNRLDIPQQRRRLIVWFTAAVVVASLTGAQAADRAGWDFTLPTLAGDRFVQLSKLSGPVLVNFWGRNCPPCVAELPLLQSFAQTNRDWTILLVCTDPPQDARVFLQKHHITLTALKSGANVEALMRGVGNRSGGLPFTVVLREGQVCTTHEGGLSAADLEAFRLAGDTHEARLQVSPQPNNHME